MRSPPVVAQFSKPAESPCLEAIIDSLTAFGLKNAASRLGAAMLEQPTDAALGAKVGRQVRLERRERALIETRLTIDDAIRMLDRAADQPGDTRWGNALAHTFALLDGAREQLRA